MVQCFIDQIECILCVCSLDLVSTIYSLEHFYRARLGWHFVWVGTLLFSSMKILDFSYQFINEVDTSN